MEIKDIKAVYFVGAGGIGMSAIARYFIKKGLVVAGYDKTPSTLTRQLEKEGMLIHYQENVNEIPHACKQRETCLVIYTPAIPAEHEELKFFRENGFEIQKRAQVLGTLTREHKGLCVAGTHGKTTTSTMCAHIMPFWAAFPRTMASTISFLTQTMWSLRPTSLTARSTGCRPT